MVRGFWDSQVGREIRWRQRWLRARLLCLDGEPERKRKGRRSGAVCATEVQRRLVEQLESFRHGTLTGPVALDLDFRVTSTQPPALYHLAKYLLDVLGPIHPDVSGLGRRHVVYQDDRQVKLLYVHLWHPGIAGTSVSDTSPGSTRIKAQPLRDVIADFALANDLRGETHYVKSWDDENEDSPLYLPDIPDVEPDLALTSERAGSDGRVRQWSNLNNWLAAFDHSQLQEALLRRTDAVLASILCRSASEIAGARPRSFLYADGADSKSVSAVLGEVQAGDRKTLLSELMTLPMPGLPRFSGEGQAFKVAVQHQLERLRTRWPVFDPLLVPLKVTFLLVPPEQGKDSDNIALEVLPLVHKILRPPLSLPILQRGLVDSDSPENEGLHNRLDVLRAHSVTAYEVIGLRRHEDDPPHGHLRLALGSGSQMGSTWSRIGGYVEKVMRS